MAEYASTFDSPATDDPLSQGGLFVAGIGSWGNLKAQDGDCISVGGANDEAARLATSSPGGAVGADQFAEVTLAGVGAGKYIFALVRIASTTDGDAYLLEAAETTGFNLYKIVDNGSTIAYNQIGTTHTATTPANGQVMRLEVTGTAPAHLVCKVNGTTLTSLTADDSSSPYTSGQPGLGMFGSATITAFNSGDLASTTQTPELYTGQPQPLAMWPVAQVCAF